MTMTPRDKLQKLVDLSLKTRRYWWLIAAFAIAGAGLSATFAIVRPKSFQSYAVLFYQERIRSSLLSNREEQVSRNIGDRYRELLLARSQLVKIINDPQLNPFPDEHDVEVAIDKMREKVKFEARGANAFRITFTDTNADRAKAVTEKLTEMLQEKDEFLRKDQARVTVAFATQQKNEAAAELQKQEQDLASFLAKHPEFVQETAQEADLGRPKDKDKKATPATAQNARLWALERQRQRIQMRLDAPPDAPPIKIAVPATPEKIAAEAAVTDARNKFNQANRELESALDKYTDQHPNVLRARTKVADAQAELKRAQAAVPPDVETTIPPASEADREKLKQDLAKLDEQIQQEQKRGTAPSPSVDATTNLVVELETNNAKLRRSVNEARERVQALTDGVFRAELDANQKLADTGAVLSIVDPAFRPVKPTGPGKTLVTIGGLALFLVLGMALSVGLAVIDDRIYRRTDLEDLGIAVLAVIPPAQAKFAAKKRKAKQ